MRVNQFFDRVYLINLKKRKDRLAEATKELNSVGIDFEVFEAIEGNPGHEVTYPLLKKQPGHVGCILSHAGVLQKAKSLNLKNVLIFEDDVQFYEGFIERFDLAISQLPSDWTMLYLSGNTQEENIKRVSQNIFRCIGTLTTHAYGINSSIFDDVILGQLKLEYPIDVFYNSQVLPNTMGYIIRPYLCKQRASFSDIVNGFRDYKLK